MWTLSQARTRLTQRLAEVSPVFWSNDERDDALNDAQRFVAAVTQGVPLGANVSISLGSSYWQVPGKLLGTYPVAGRVNEGANRRALTYVPIEVANAVDPGWRRNSGSPRWLVVAPDENRVYVTPVPNELFVYITVSILPPDLEADGDELFAGEGVMEKYLSPTLNLAVAYLLLKERYDGDAERFYAMAAQELAALGVDPARIPSRPQQEVPSE